MYKNDGKDIEIDAELMKLGKENLILFKYSKQSFKEWFYLHQKKTKSYVHLPVMYYPLNQELHLPEYVF